MSVRREREHVSRLLDAVAPGAGVAHRTIWLNCPGRVFPLFCFLLCSQGSLVENDVASILTESAADRIQQQADRIQQHLSCKYVRRKRDLVLIGSPDAAD